MPFPCDELYKGYIRRNLARFVTIVKSTEIMVHLPCLTQSDRDEITAKRESRGNYDAMERLLDCLKRRENWPDDLIEALRSCEQWELASELEKEYESLKVRPTRSGGTPASVPATAPVDASRHTVSNLPEHAATEAVPAVPAPSGTGHSASLPSPFQAASADKGITPNHTDTLSGPGEPDSQVSASPHVTQPRVTEEVKNASIVSASSPQESLTGRPVEDTNPTDARPNPFPKLIQTSNPGNDQVTDNHPHAEPSQAHQAQRTARATASSADLNQADNPATSISTDDAMSEEMYFSKPGTLRSHSAELHQYFDNQRAAESVEEEPYSGNSDLSEMSETVQHPEPEENSYESLLDSQDVHVIEGHVTEEIPVLNHAGQPTSPAKEKLTTLHDNHPTSGRADIATHDCPHEGGPSFPYNLLENYSIPLFVLAGACILVLLGRLRK
ncbi:mitochondrial antiviral-signaling protein-like isoform X3 [Brienomyrus brachyistius]|uniref:mitochondrial antiviral-signaling protein-like isoform X3 n=1 Tax=Brienomyrus brachyistius TaxID=42636 RepID=UPI0020B2975E|nr:mitochondrial antiviral-signaling protein-like isoform X3 [Brienomyrus brachyistius]XP_048853003.1 mitochondrial antiviral-signaling protein-like isoform X3 [Brienomyrus brachyistius]XP_048853004.1 mitochondrial antiviral-signaling protein-like isoform X3 [Brienomyrus brachyistius]